MRKLSAHYLFPASQSPIKYGIIEVNHNGSIVALHNVNGKLEEKPNIEFYNGILIPGFLCPLTALDSILLEKITSDYLGLKEFIFSLKGNNQQTYTESALKYSAQDVLNELKSISFNFSEITFEQLIKLATLDTAKALCLNSTFGSFEPNKSPGVNLITQFNYSKMMPTPESQLVKLL